MVSRGFKQDWFLNGTIAILAAFSLLILRSATPALFWTQMVWFAVAAVIIAWFSHIDWRPFLSYRWLILSLYVISVALLLLTLIVAPTVRETRSWLPIGPFRFQTSEFAKGVLLLMLAYFFTRRHYGVARLGTVLLSALYFIIPTALVLVQPDWGSAFIFVGLWVGFLIVGGIRIRHILWGFFIFFIVAVMAWFFVLADYQKERVLGFLEPEYDPLGVNYSVIQAKIAIGSAGILGKGFRQGTQLQLGFLTEPATDFIFAAFVEEWGLLGGIALVAVFAALVFRIMFIGFHAPNNFSRFICLGTALVFILHFFLNVGSAVGLVPVVGIPFPFFSYGGSSILTKAALVGIIQSIAVRSAV